MPPTTIIRTGEARELLALIPFQLGFRPRESAVVVSVRGPRSRVGLIARVDLADLADPVRGPQVARSLVSHLVGDGAQYALLVVFTERPSRQGRADVVDAARGHLSTAGQHLLPLGTCWVVGPGGWYEADCVDRSCCPEDGRPLTDLEGTQVGAEMVLAGAGIAATREQIAAIAPAPAAARRSARRAAERWAGRAPTSLSPSAAHRWRRDGLAVWRAELGRALRTAGDEAAGTAHGSGFGRGPGDGEAPTATVLGKIQAALADVLVRDAVLLGFVDGVDRVGDRLVAGDDCPEVGAALRLLVDPDDGVPPDMRRHAAAERILEQVVAHARRDGQAPALTLLAVLSWWRGDGARAGLLIDRALSMDPGYRLAALLDQTLAAGMAPGWLRRPRE